MSIFSSVVRRRDARLQQSTQQHRDGRRGSARARSGRTGRASLTLACTEALEPRQFLSASLVSANSTNTASANGATNPLFGPFISTTGRYVAFESPATNIVPGVTSGQQVYLRDRISGTTQLVSRGLNNAPAAGNSWVADMTPDGRYVLFFTTANLTSSNIEANRVAVDTNNTIDLYVRDMQTGQTFLISGDDAPGGTGPTGGALPPQFVAAGVTNDGTRPTLPAYISDDGRYVSFVSPTDDLPDFSDATANPQAATDQNGVDDIFVRDRLNNVTLLVTEGATQNQSPTGTQVGIIDSYAMSASGGQIAFSTTAQMQTADTSGVSDVYYRQVLLGTTVQASTINSGFATSNVAISAGGDVVAFQHPDANNTPGSAHVDHWTPASGAGGSSPFTGAGSFGPIAISDDGRYIVFRSTQTNLIDQGTTGANVFRFDRTTDVIEVVSLNSNGANDVLPGNANAGRLSISTDGRFVAYQLNGTGSDPSIASYGAAGQNNVYVRDMTSTQVTLLSVSGSDATLAANGNSYQPIISGDGKVVAFISSASNLVLNDTNGAPDVFTADVITQIFSPLRALLSAPHVNTGGATSYTFQVTYSGPRPIVLASIDSNDVFVARGNPGDPNYQQFSAVLVSVNSGTNATAITATYRIIPPGGSWDSGDNGTYSVQLRNRQISDVQGAQLLAQTLGTFNVDIAPKDDAGTVFNASVSEAAGQYQLQIPLAPGSDAVPGSTVSYVVVSGSAILGQDFNIAPSSGLLQSGTLTLKGDGTFDPIPFDIVNDPAVEGNETFRVIFSNATPGLVLAFQQANITILDDDSAGSGTVVIPGAINTDPVTGETPGSSITLNNGVPTITATETTGDIVIPLSRAGTGTTASTVTFNYIVYSTPSDTAIPGQHFVADSGTITFAAGSNVPTSVVSAVFGTTDKLRVRLLHDFQPSGDRDFTVVLTNATTGLVIGGTSIEVVSIDVDSAVQFATPSVTVADDDGIISIPITRFGNLAAASTVTLSIVGSSAIIGTDFEFVDEANPNNPNPTITFAAGEATKTVRIRLLSRPFNPGSFREIALSIGSAAATTPPYATVAGTPAAMTIRINNLDAAGPQVQNVDFTVADGRITAITVQFDEPIKRAGAKRTANFTLFPRSASGRLGQFIQLKSARYNASTNTVTLTPASSLPADALYQLNVNGRGTIVDVAGNRLDGDADGRPGGTAVTVFGTGRTINYTDADNDLVSLRLDGPGTIKVVNLNRDNVTVEVLGASSTDSELLGTVTKRKGGNGTADPFIRLNGATFDPGDDFVGEIEASQALKKKKAGLRVR